MTFDPTHFDPSEHADGGGDLIPPGVYVVMATQMNRTDERGKPQIDFTIRPLFEAGSGRVVSDGFQPLFETATLTEKAIWRFGNMCQAIGTGPFNANSDRDVQAKVLGKPFKVKVKSDTWNGKDRRKIDSYMELTSADQQRYEKWREDQALGGGNDFGGDSGASAGSSDLDSDDIPF